MKKKELLQLRVSSLYKKMETIEKEWNDEVSTFSAQVGDQFPEGPNSGILVYGRCNNGWDRDDEGQFSSEQMDLEAKKRPFWGLMKDVCQHYYPTEWYRKVTWSNTAKVSPIKGGKLSNKLWYAQEEYLMPIMKAELECLSPKVVILVVGNNVANDNWDKPLHQLYPDLKEKCKLTDIVWGISPYGKDLISSVYKKNNILFIITERPDMRGLSAECKQAQIDGIIKLIGQYS
ncbi:MAG: hypothetical protein LKI72_03810 [Prevotella sp.]|jgi:hypothetical protein|nr:hypothetical protein [Prevotella sp.]